jgi:hypothetical protein
MKLPLRAFGYWGDTRIGSPSGTVFIAPQSLVGTYESEEVRDRVMSYLDRGHKLVGWLGYSHCRFNCGKPDHEMGSCDLTDGIWVWPEGLSHYVRSHAVQLPTQFLRHMEELKWKIPEIDPQEIEDLEDRDGAYAHDFSMCRDSDLEIDDRAEPNL